MLWKSLQTRYECLCFQKQFSKFLSLSLVILSIFLKCMRGSWVLGLGSLFFVHVFRFDIFPFHPPFSILQRSVEALNRIASISPTPNPHPTSYPNDSHAFSLRIAWLHHGTSRETFRHSCTHSSGPKHNRKGPGTDVTSSICRWKTDARSAHSLAGNGSPGRQDGVR